MVRESRSPTPRTCCPSQKLRSAIPKSLAPLFRALGDETRLEMVGLLAASPGGELCVCDLEEHFQLAQPTISHHLKVLREAGVVTSERQASWVYYALNREALVQVDDLARAISRSSTSSSSSSRSASARRAP